MTELGCAARIIEIVQETKTDEAVHGQCSFILIEKFGIDNAIGASGIYRMASLTTLGMTLCSDNVIVYLNTA
jgi:hypothetical protein